MSSKGYATASDVNTYLGIALTTAQAAAVTGMLEMVEQAIDAYTGHPYLTGAITGEVYQPITPTLYLRSRPVTSVQAVRGRYPFDGGAATLIAGREYELQDAARGLLYVGYWQPYTRLEVDYTPATALPERVRWATALTLAHYLSPHLNGMTSEVAQYSVFGQVSVRLRDEGLPPDARLLLDPLSSPVLVG